MMATQKRVSKKPERRSSKRAVNSNKPQTFEEKLSDTKARMNKIVEGNDAGYHLR
jgi:hypothetical protein